MTAGSTDPAGGPFGGTVGFNVQNWGLVFGLEGDLAGNWMRNNTSSGQFRPAVSALRAGA